MDTKAKNVSGVTNNNTLNDQRVVNYYANGGGGGSQEIHSLQKQVEELQKEINMTQKFEEEVRKTLMTHAKKLEGLEKTPNIQPNDSGGDQEGWQKERLGLHNKIKQLEKTVCELTKQQNQTQEHKQNNETTTLTVLSIVEDTLLAYKSEVNIYNAHQLLRQHHQTKEEFTRKLLEDANGRLVLSNDGKYLLKRKNDEVCDKVDGDQDNNGNNKRQKHVR